MRPLSFCVMVLLALVAVPLHAEVKLPVIFGDHMVLQQEASVPVWGRAAPGESVTVSTAGQKAATTAGPDGKWMVRLEGLKTTGHPIELTVSGENTIVLKDVLVGEVWVCSGQSNMVFPLKEAGNAAIEVPQATDSRLRLFTVKTNIAFEPQADCQGVWTVCSPKVAQAFSAIGYFFGHELQQKHGVPVGMIGAYLGDSPAQAWTSLKGLEAEPTLKSRGEEFRTVKASAAQSIEKFKKELLPQWQKAVKQWKARGKKGPMPGKPKNPAESPSLPTGLNNGMIAPLIPFAIKGVIWFQGAANANDAVEYRTLFPAMIKDWRTSWGQGEFPFLFIQLANANPPNDKKGLFPAIREAQLMALALPKTGMAVAIDIGDPHATHFKDKWDAADRLFLAAEHLAYGKDIIYSGPIFRDMKVEADKIRVSFKHVGGGLMIGSSPISQSPPASHLKGFTIAGADKQFVEAHANIDGDSVVVFSAHVKRPKAVRYDWDDAPDGNLYNQEGLPASPFRTDDREVPVLGK